MIMIINTSELECCTCPSSNPCAGRCNALEDLPVFTVKHDNHDHDDHEHHDDNDNHGHHGDENDDRHCDHCDYNHHLIKGYNGGKHEQANPD